MKAVATSPMRMARAQAAGGPDVLRVDVVERPAIGPEDVLVAVRLAGVNFADVNARRGTYAAVTGPRGLGRDILGEVVAVGDRVEGGALRVGLRVAGFSSTPAYAEFAVAHHTLVWPVPDAVSDEQAAAFPTVGQTAYHLMRRAGGLRTGESVLVTAAAGGVGSVAVPLATLLGAGRVVAAAGDVERARTAGAPEAVAYPDLASVDPVDLVLDGVGGGVRDGAVARLAPFGRLVHFGNSAATTETLPAPRALRERCLGVVGFHLDVLRRNDRPALAAAAELLMGWLAAGRLHIPVHAVLPLDRAAEAHRLLESRQVRGKVLLAVGSPGGP
ncbi:quinone oxidoreductase family protein [Pseudonocardia sp. GCM10023141]|uniref:quinone oxidoreductase family protein n=1 Tax=Pseudonocardia sp. GCM10023141 TaxID=3252653 RepID=UPI0036238F3D